MEHELEGADNPQTPEETFDRRRGPRRSAGDGLIVAERRYAERRARMPGLSGLLDAVAAAADEAPAPQPDRRRGPRREPGAEAEVPQERRQTDRRKRKPGLAALMGAILAPTVRETTK